MPKRTLPSTTPLQVTGDAVGEPWSEIIDVVRRELGPLEARVLASIYLDGRTTRQAAALAAVEVSELCAALTRVHHHLAVRVLL